MIKNKISIALVMFMLFTCIGIGLLPFDGSSYAFASSNEAVEITDTFSKGNLDTDIWERNDHFYTDNNRLVTQLEGNGKLKLKGDYSGYDHYEISIELVGFDVTFDNKSNGGIGISGTDGVLSFHENLNEQRSGSKYWYLKKLNVDDFDTGASRQEFTIDSKRFNRKRTQDTWFARPLKIEMLVDKRDDGDFDVEINVYDVALDSKLKSQVYTFTEDELNFSEIYITDNADADNWYLLFDNFTFRASMDEEVPSQDLEVAWKNHQYEVSWNDNDNGSLYYGYYWNLYPMTSSERQARKIVFDDTSGYARNQFGMRFYIDSRWQWLSSYVAGNIPEAYALTGEFSGNNYNVIWPDFTAYNLGNDQKVTYSLYYGDDANNVTTPVTNGIQLSSDERGFLFENIDASEYYDKYLQLVTYVFYKDYGTTRFYTEPIRIKREAVYNIQLDLSHVNDHYVFMWPPTDVFSKYTLYRDSNSSKLDAIDASVAGEDIPNTAENGYIRKAYADTDPEYNQKYFILGGHDFSRVHYSNKVQTKGDITSPVLHWQKNGNSYFFKWDDFDADQIELYRGNEASSITTLVSDDVAILSSDSYTLTGSTADAYDNQYFRVRFKKDGVWYYSTIVRATSFNQISGEIVAVKKEDQTDQENFVINWDVVNGAQRYDVYYVDSNNVKHQLGYNVSGRTYNVPDIFDTNKAYLRKAFYVEAACTMTDEFGFTYDYTLTSPVVMPREIDFSDHLEGKLDEENQLTLTWTMPTETGNDGGEVIDVSDYKIYRASSKNNFETIALESFTKPFVYPISKVWTDVKVNGSGEAFYQKFYKVKAVIDNVVYESNVVYAQGDMTLRAERSSDDWTLIWGQVPNADKVEIYYSEDTFETEPNAEPTNRTYLLYTGTVLGVNSSEYTLKDIDSSNKNYDKRYFKIVATFADDTKESNVIFIDVSKVLPKIEGLYNDDGAYSVSWEVVPWAKDGYKLVYENITTDEEGKEIKTWVDIENFDQSATSVDYSNVTSKAFYGKLIKLAALDGNVKAYSNTKFVKEETLSGDAGGLYGEEYVSLKLNNETNVIYTFKVLKEMKDPYIKLELNGSQYLKFDKIAVRLMATEGGTVTDIPIELVTEVDDTNGVTILYVHPEGDYSNFKADGGVEYEMVVDAVLDLNPMKAYAVYEALTNFNAELKRWALPFHIADLKISSEGLDVDMFVQCEAHWIPDNAVSEDEQYRIHVELFNTEINIQNKKQLPGSF